MTAHRRERQGAILRLIGAGEIATQAELADALRGEGFEVVQTTVSRDIADLGLIKVRGANGRRVYAAPGTPDGDRLRDLTFALRRWAHRIDANESLVVVFTPNGFASALAEEIDSANHPLVLATVAGENTILVLPRAGIAAGALCAELSRHILEGAA